jgi:superoxide dismutase, Fe-Mn family
MPIQPGTYILGPENGTLSVRTGRMGAAAAAGHDLLIHVTAWQATLEVGDDPAQTSIVVDADAASLRVREGTGGMQPLEDEDKANIHQTIDDEILKRGAIAFRSKTVDAVGDGSRLRVRGELTLLDQTAPISFVLQIGDDGTLGGSAVVKQSSWGIKPYSALFGALRVADEVEVAIDTGLKPREEVPLPGYERIRPRQLKPALLELEGISRTSVIAHHKLYESYVFGRNEILARLAGLGRAHDPELRALKVELSHAVGGIKNHEVYFEHLGGEGGEPNGPIGDLITRDFDSVGAWRADLRATALAGRGWAWTAYDWGESRLFNSLGDAENASPSWNATPLVALDVEEHAYFLDFQTDRAAYVDAFFDNLDWIVVNDWIAAYGIDQSR